MKKLFLSLASVPLFAVFAANAEEPTALDETTASDQPTTLDAATLDGITAAGSEHKRRCKCDGGDQTFQFNQPIASPQTQIAANVGVLSWQSNEQSAFQGNIND